MKPKKAKNITLAELVKQIKLAKTVLVATHEHPDGDGLGSVLAFAEGLKQLKKKVVCYNVDTVPHMYQFMPGWKLFRNTLPTVNPKARTPKGFDLSFIIDLGEMERVGKEFVAYPARGTTISIDHHASGSHNCDYNFCLPKQAASGEVVYKILKALKVKFNKAIATNLFTTLVTDTGSFKYSNTTAETFAIASELKSYGVDVWQIAKNCFETNSPTRIELLKRVLPTLTKHASAPLAWMHQCQNDLTVTGATGDESDGFINYPRSLAAVEVAVFFKQMPDGSGYKISLRSKDWFDVAAFAAKYNGGGHKRASGFKVLGDFETVKTTVLNDLIKQLSVQ